MKSQIQSSNTNSNLNSVLIKQAIRDSFAMMNPVVQSKNTVMFVVYVGSIITTVICIENALRHFDLDKFKFEFQISIWLWFTVFFANFAESIAQGRGKAQAQSLRKNKQDLMANKLDKNGSIEIISATQLKIGDIVMVSANEIVPCDGEVIEGVASVDESAITGESAPVIRESGGDRSSVTGGTTVISDWLKIKITAEPGQTFLDKMIALVEGASRQKTPNEIALDILLCGLTLIFLIAVVTIYPFCVYSFKDNFDKSPDLFSLISLLVCLIPTTIGGLLSAIGIAGMDRVLKFNVLAKSGKAVEAAGDVDTLLLDKTGTITMGNRQVSEFISDSNVTYEDFAQAAYLASVSDETPEGRSIVAFASKSFNKDEKYDTQNANFIEFSAHTRLSGIDIEGRQIRKGACDSIVNYVQNFNFKLSQELNNEVVKISQAGGTPLLVADNKKGILGVIYLKDIIKNGMQQRFALLREMGIRTIMITGDNPLTAAAIAAEAGVNDFLAQATPQAKMDLIKKEQTGGRLVAMTGDGTNDAPALAQADVGVAMSSGTQAAKEAGNMIDLDSDPTKLIEIVSIGKQLLMTRGALTTFSIANDIAKYFAILPAIFGALYAIDSSKHGLLWKLNILNLHSAQSAILSAVIFNALIIIMLIPLALRGVKYQPMDAKSLLERNLLIYGLGGIIAPFPGIWIIDQLIVMLHLVPAY